MPDRSWPEDWTERMAGRGCPMCVTVGHGDNKYGVHVFTGEFAEVSLERRTLLPGYCVVVWRHGHVSEPVPDAELRRQAAALRVLLAS